MMVGVVLKARFLDAPRPKVSVMYAKCVWFARSLSSLLLLLIGTTSLFAQTNEDFQRVEEEILSNIQRGKLGDKTVAFLPWAGDFQDKIIAVARAESATNRTNQALKVWQFYFRHCNFSPYESSRWNNAAMDFLKVVKQSGDEVKQRYAEDLAAGPTWRALLPAAERVTNNKWDAPLSDDTQADRSAREREQNRKTVEQLAEKLLRSHPKSMFTVPALMVVAKLPSRSDHADLDQTVAAYFRRGLKELEEAKAPRRHQIWMLHAMSSRFSADRATRENAYQRIAQLTDIAAEKRYAEFRLADPTTDYRSTRDGRQERRGYEDFLTKYPQAFRAPRARSRIVQSWLSEKRPEEALRTLRHYDHPNYNRAAVPSDLLRMANAFLMENEYDQALTLLEEVERRFPQSRRQALVQSMMADCHRGRGDRQKMFASYHKAVAAVPKDRLPLRVLESFSNVGSSPFIYLGRHYMRKRQWAKAHSIWKAYDPQSWCGNCEWSLISQRRTEMTICEMNQTDLAGALEIFDRAAAQKSRYVSQPIRCQLVEMAQRNGKLQVLRERFTTSPTGKAADFLSPAKDIRDYITLIDQAAEGRYQALWNALGDRAEDWGWTALTDDYDDGWKKRRIMHILAACGSDAKPFLLTQAKQADPGHRAALIILSRMKAADVWPLIQQRWSQREAQLTQSAAIDYLFAAWLLKGDASTKWVKQLVLDRESHHHAAARAGIAVWDTEPIVWLKPIARKER